MSDYGDDASEAMMRESARAMGYLMRDAMRRSARGSVRSSTKQEDINESVDIIEAAQRAPFTEGAPDNPVLQFKTVRHDPRAGIMCDPMRRQGIPFKAEYRDGFAFIETAPATAPFLMNLATAYVKSDKLSATRFANLERYPGGRAALVEMRSHPVTRPMAAAVMRGDAERCGIIDYAFEDRRSGEVFHRPWHPRASNARAGPTARARRMSR